MKVNEALKTAIHDALADELFEAMDCMRQWEAWSVGTMSQDDFVIIADDAERMNDLTNVVMAAIDKEMGKS